MLQMWREFIDGDDFVSAPLFTLGVLMTAFAVVCFVASLL